MGRIAIVLILILSASCSAPKEIVKSSDLTPNSHIEGNGDFTLVMDAGMGNWSIFYQPILKKLKADYKVCLIDRAGYSMDSVSANPRDAKTIASEIDQVLKDKGITNNIILVGHSLGALHVRMYQSLFPEKVIGIVLLDGAHPEMFSQLPNAFHEVHTKQYNSLDKVIELAQKGYLKYSKAKIPTFGLPEYLHEEYYKVTTEPEYYYTMKAEISQFENNLEQVGKLGDLGELPLLIIGSKNSLDESLLPGVKDFPFEEHNKKWLELQEDLSRLSSNSIFIKSNGNHYLNVTDSELVAEEIKLFINQMIK